MNTHIVTPDPAFFAYTVQYPNPENVSSHNGQVFPTSVEVNKINMLTEQTDLESPSLRNSSYVIVD